MAVLEWLVFNVVTADIFDHHAEQVVLVVEKYLAVFDGIMKKYDSSSHQKDSYG